MDREAINHTIEHSDYSSSDIPELERHVTHQISSGEYHFDANHLLLKLYQFYPNEINKKIVTQILIKAMSNMPNTDLMSHLYLIPEHVQSDDIISNVVMAHDLLERAHFKEFWARVDSGAEFEMPLFSDKIREFIVGVICKTFLSISKQELGQLLNVDIDAYLAKNAQKYAWQVEGDVIQLNERNTSKLNPPSTILFNQFTKVLGSLG